MSELTISVNTRLLDLDAAATLLGISPHTLRSWTQQGKVPVVRLGSLLQYDRQDLEAFIQNAKQRWTPQQALAANARKGHNTRKQREQASHAA